MYQAARFNAIGSLTVCSLKEVLFLGYCSCFGNLRNTDIHAFLKLLTLKQYRFTEMEKTLESNVYFRFAAFNHRQPIPRRAYALVTLI